MSSGGEDVQKHIVFSKKPQNLIEGKGRKEGNRIEERERERQKGRGKERNGEKRKRGGEGEISLQIQYLVQDSFPLLSHAPS